MRLDERLHEVRCPSPVESALDRAHNLDSWGSLAQRALEAAPAQLDAGVPEPGHHEEDLASVRKQSAHGFRATAPQQIVVRTDVEEPAAWLPGCCVELVGASLEACDRRVQGLRQPPGARVGWHGYGHRIHFDMAGLFAFRQVRELIDERKNVPGRQCLHRGGDPLDWPAEGSPHDHPHNAPACGHSGAAGRDEACQRWLARQPERCGHDQTRDGQPQPEVGPSDHDRPGARQQVPTPQVPGHGRICDCLCPGDGQHGEAIVRSHTYHLGSPQVPIPQGEEPARPRDTVIRWLGARTLGIGRSGCPHESSIGGES